MRKRILTILILTTGLLVFIGHKAGIYDRRYVPEVKFIYYKLGDRNVPLKVQQYGKNSDLVFVSLHDDESTSVEATRRILAEEGGLLIEVENYSRRNIRFRLNNGTYSVDPNRMFSRQGISKSLKEFGRAGTKAIEEVERFAERILQLIPEDAVCVIALHNNTHGRFSARTYAAGNERSREARKVYLNKEKDEDDFFLTTDEFLYEKLANRRYNVVLQENLEPVEDGSLSVYCGKMGIRYVNLETEHGKVDTYHEMMEDLVKELRKLNLNNTAARL